MTSEKRRWKLRRRYNGSKRGRGGGTGKKIDLKTNLSKGSTDEHVAAELGMSMTQSKNHFERAKSGRRSAT